MKTKWNNYINVLHEDMILLVCQASIKCKGRSDQNWFSNGLLRCPVPGSHAVGFSIDVVNFAVTSNQPSASLC